MLEKKKVEDTIVSLGGDKEAAAEVLGVSSEKLLGFLRSDPELQALFCQDPGPVIEGAQLMNRESPTSDMDPEEMALVDMVKNDTYDAILEGFRATGVSDKTIDDVKTLCRFEKNAGRFMLGSMDIMQRLVSKSAMRLDGYLEYLHEQVMNDEMTAKEKAMWIRAFGMTMDQLLKANKDVREGTLALVRASNKDDKGKGKSAKPAFTPIQPNS